MTEDNMSNRTLIELNHDYCPRDYAEAAEFGRQIANYMRCGGKEHLPDGVTWKHMRHHSEPCPGTAPRGDGIKATDQAIIDATWLLSKDNYANSKYSARARNVARAFFTALDANDDLVRRHISRINALRANGARPAGNTKAPASGHAASTNSVSPTQWPSKSSPTSPQGDTE